MTKNFKSPRQYRTSALRSHKGASLLAHKTHFNAVFLAVFMLLLAIIGYVVLRSWASQNAAVNLIASTQSVAPGSNVTTAVELNTGGNAVNAFEVFLNYDQSKLEFVSIDSSGSPFAMKLSEGQAGDGRVRIMQAALDVSANPDNPSGQVKPVTGVVTVAQVTFKVLAPSGSTSVQIANDSVVASGENPQNLLSTRGSITFTVTGSQDPGDEEPPEEEPGDEEPGDEEPGQPTDASFTLNAPRTEVRRGDTFRVDVAVNAGQNNVNAVSAVMHYDASKLEFVNVSSGNSDFPIVAEESNRNGVLTLARSILPPPNSVSGTLRIASVNFKALAGSGTTKVAIDSSSVLVSVDTATNVAHNFASLDVKLTGGGSQNPSPQPSPTPTPTPAPTPSPGESQPPTERPTRVTAPTTATETPTNGETPVEPVDVQPKTPEAPAIANFKPAAVGFRSATFTWNTDKPTTAVIEYGPTRTLGFTALSDELKTSHELTLDPSLLQVGRTYYYRLKTIDADGNETVSEVRQFTTKGYTVVVTVQDTDGNPIAGVMVQMFSDPRETQTDSQGQATFNNMAPGTHTIRVTIDGKEYSKEITVDDVHGIETATGEIATNLQVDPQYFAFDMASMGQGGSLPVGVIIAVVAAAVVIGGGGLWLARHHRKFAPAGHVSINQKGGNAASGVTIKPANELENALDQLKGADSGVKPGEVVRPKNPGKPGGNSNP